MFVVSLFYGSIDWQYHMDTIFNFVKTPSHCVIGNPRRETSDVVRWYDIVGDIIREGVVS